MKASAKWITLIILLFLVIMLIDAIVLKTPHLSHH